MKMKVLQQVPERLWEEAVQSCPFSTFFHTPAWAKILHATFGDACTVATRAYSFGGGRIVVVPIIETEKECKGFFRTLESSALGVYGGFLAEQPPTAEEMTQILKHLKSFRNRRIQIFGNPYIGADLPPGFEDGTVRHFTQTIDLRAFSGEEALLASYADNVRRRLKRSKTEGFTVRKAETLSEVGEFFQVYRLCLARWGDSTSNDYPLALFENILKLGSEEASIWIILKDGKVAGGNVSFYHNKKCIDWHHSCLREYFPQSISQHLTHYMILDALNRKFETYDFNPSGKHEGTVVFKESFGTQKRYFSGYAVDKNPVFETYSKLRALFKMTSSPSQNSLN